VREARELAKYAEALPDCDKALSLNGRDSWTLFQRGMLYLRARDYSLAADDFQASIRHGAEIKYAYNALAQAQLHLEHLSDALLSIDTFVNMFPKASSGYLTRAQIYQAMHDVRRALADAELALSYAETEKDATTIAQARALVASLLHRHS
jgi:tetratricopeptide (TPR) repeat protein